MPTPDPRHPIAKFCPPRSVPIKNGWYYLLNHRLTYGMALEPIAIIGLGCRYPGAANPEAFWQLLKNGVDAVKPVPPNRWDQSQFEAIATTESAKASLRSGGYLDAVDQFDPLFFGIAPREVTTMDPQQRLLLEVAWEAIEDAGVIPAHLRGTETGVFVGIGTHDYSVMLWQEPIDDPYVATGTGNCIAANRISYIFDLKGPSLAVDTACSSSLVAIHLACQSLWTNESTLALAGGVNLLLLPTVTLGFARGGFMSSSGRCRSFDASADGYVRSEGAGMVLLKPLSQALADADSIYAVIRGTAVNQDGFSNGLAAPNLAAQEQVLRSAYRRAGISPGKVQYIEAHGTGTKLGDPIEMSALGLVLAEDRSPDSFCAVGSVKSNIGHTETAAGVAGVIKVALSLQRGQIPPNLHFQTPNPQIDFDRLPLRVPTQIASWQTTPAIAGVNAFGFGGTNAHAVLEAAPPIDRDSTEIDRPLHLFTLSAKNAAALRSIAQRYDEFLTLNPAIELGDLCFTANVKRSQFPQRLSIVTDSTIDLQQQLRAFVRQPESSGATEARSIAFLFTGQGSQAVNMGRSLYQTQPLFRQIVDELAPQFAPDLLSVLYPSQADAIEAADRLDQTIYTQPALFVLEYAIARLWMAWGVQPSVVMGHSIGESVAACIAGVFSLEAAIKLVAARGRLMQALPQTGSMVSVLADAKTIEPLIASEPLVAIAAINAPDSTVISGDRTAVAQVVHQLTAIGIKTTPLNVSHAFHSPLMTPMLKEFAEVAASISYSSPQIPIVSNLTGNLISDEIATPEYWCNHIRQPVQFMQGMTTLARQGCTVFLEIGAKPILLGMGQQCLPAAQNYSWLPSLRPGQAEWQTILTSLAALYRQGVAIDWAAFDRPYDRQTLHLPTYPFQRQRYWWDAARSMPPRSNQHPLLGNRLNLSGTSEIRFESHLSDRSPAFLADHQIATRVVFPAAAVVEMAIAAADAIELTPVEISDLQIEQALLLSGEPTTVQLILTPRSDGYQFQLFSLQADWVRHAIGLLTSEARSHSQIDLGTVRSQFSGLAIPGATYYEQLRQQNLNYGTSFQAIEQIWSSSDAALSQMRLPDALDADAYHLHPVLLDGCFQTIAACPQIATGTYLPTAIQSLRLGVPAQERVWSRVKQIQVQSPQDRSPLIADLQIINSDGSLVAEITGLTLQPTSHQRKPPLPESLRSSLYELSWQADHRDRPVLTQPRRWLILSDRQWGTALATALNQAGDRTEFISAESIDPLDATLKQQLGAIDAITDVVFLWMDAALPAQETLTQTCTRLCGGLLHLIQAINANSATTPRLWLVTQGAQAIAPTDAPPQIAQAALWGMGRTLQQEQPDLRCTCIDLETIDLSVLLSELRQPDRENQIAYRQGDRYVARLTPQQLKDAIALPDSAFRLGLKQYGLDNLTLMPHLRRSPGQGEVEIQVRSAGVNFRDVLNALGMLQPYLEQMGFATAADVPFGGECAGVVVAVGAGITNVQVGDAVIAAQAIGSLGQFVTVNAQWIAPKPKSLTFAEAATIPIAFLTAAHAFRLAKLQKGDRVLIHAAAGGVGLAAVQLAQQIGAEVYATASAAKQDFLRSIGVQHVFDSRSIDFADQIAQVDVVLNSLNGEYIPRSLGLLAPNGRFVEIGKLGIWSAEQMQAARSDVDYFTFDLLEVAQAQPNYIAALLNDLTDRFEQGKLQPLPHKVFEVTAAAAAFRHMAQAKHIGKVVLSLPPVPPQHPIIRSNASYWITGGFGALGQLTAQWLIDQGATDLVLIGRSAPNQDLQQQIDRWGKQGVKITAVQADITDREAIAPLLTLSPHPLRGIVHAAGVLDDGILRNLTLSRFERVMSAKLEGAWNLHDLTRSLPIDFFVCFSSIASVFGSAGQANYAAANAALDAFIQHRRRLGLPGLSINWGAWAIGMTTHLSDREQQRLTRQGMTLITPEAGLSILTGLLQQNRVQTAVLPIDWSTFQATQATALPPFFEQVLPTAPVAIPAAVTVPKGDRKTQLQQQIRTRLAKVLGFSNPELIDLHDSFADLGMDSLMAVEFTRQLQADVSQAFSQSLLFDYQTIAALSDYVANHLLTEEMPAAIADVSASEPAPEVVEISIDRSPFEVPASIDFDLEAIPEQCYQFQLLPEYQSLKQDLNRVEKMGNPFFTIHAGTARDLTFIHGQPFINYASYNYLGMSGEPIVSQAAIAAIEQYGTSVSASRVLSGERPIHQALEQAIARFLGVEDCLVFVSGHATNVTTIGHLFGEKDLILCDALSHNSIREGCRASGAEVVEFPHNDWRKLEQLLAQYRLQYQKVLIAIEGVYSADGDIAPLPQLVALKKRFKTFLMVDEAHSIGVLGRTGRGISEHFGIVATDVDLWMGTLSKSFASCGGYIAGCKALIEYLKYTAPGFVFSVGMTPSNTAAAYAALQLIQQQPQRVQQLQARSQLFLNLAKKEHLNTGSSQDTPIIPIIIGEPQKAIQLCHRLADQGIHVQPMVYPSVPHNLARLRFFLSCLHTEEQIRFTVSTLAAQLSIE